MPPAFRQLAARFDPERLEAPRGRALLRLREDAGVEWDALVDGDGAHLVPARRDRRPDARLTADRATWSQLAADAADGLKAYRDGRLEVRGSLHVGIGFLAATAPATGPLTLRHRQVETALGTVSTLTAGDGPVVLLLHGLGATKASFLPTVVSLADRHRCVAVDLPGFGDSAKPLFAAYDPAFFSRWTLALMDRLGVHQAHVVGHSLGGRVALEMGRRHPERVRRLVLMTPSLAWRRGREWAGMLRLVRPELGLLQVTPRQLAQGIVEWLFPEVRKGGWGAAGADEFLRAFLTPAGRAAFYATARQIYLEEPDGPDGFWSRLGELSPPSLFLWGHTDRLVPIAFERHVQRVLPRSAHVELPCGHVPQLQAPRETHAAIREFLADGLLQGEPSTP